MNDLISRQAAIEAVRTMQTYKLFAGDDMILIDKAEVQTELMTLPSAEPPYQYSEACVRQICGERDILQDMVDNMTEPKTGKWEAPYVLRDGSIGACCSQCGAFLPTTCDYNNYCPNCGSYNGGEQDGNT